MKEKLEITKKKPKQDKGHKYISLRVEKERMAQVEKLANEANLSKNRVINEFIAYGLKNCIVKDSSTPDEKSKDKE